MSDHPDEVLIDRRMHAWRPEDWHLLDRREGQVRYVRGELYDSKPCSHVVGETTQHCALAEDEVKRLTQRAEQAEATLAEMCDKAETFVRRAEQAEAELAENEGVINVWRGRAERAEADRDTLGAHLERTQARAMKLESKVADRRALAQWAVDLEAERDRLRADLQSASEALRRIAQDDESGTLSLRNKARRTLHDLRTRP